MKLMVNQDRCIGCGLCLSIAEELFGTNDDGISTLKVDKVPEDMKDLAIEAIENCPVSAIVEIGNNDTEEKKVA